MRQHDLGNGPHAPGTDCRGSGGKKTVVEDCLALDVNRWIRLGLLNAGVHRASAWRWTDPVGRGFRVAYEVDMRDQDPPVVRLRHAAWGHTPSSQPVQPYTVRLASTRPRLGGLRWWFLCPHCADGRECGRRMGKLYLPPGGQRFGCRHCHALTYRSCQENHQYDGLYAIAADRWGCDFATVKRRMAALAAA